jgi:antirestriction protein
MPTNSTEKNPSIYVGTYKKYNEGSLFGKWVDLTEFSDKDEFYEACKELHSDEDEPEFMFQDWEFINKHFISESHLSDSIFSYLNKLQEIECGERKEAFETYLKYFQNIKNDNFDFEEAFDDFEERYQGYYDGSNPESDFTYQLVEDTGLLNSIPETIQTYFDYDKYQRDLFISDYTEYHGHIFCNN